jgi:hypothetical protein
MFVDIILVKLSRDFTRPLGISRGLKDLLHVLNAIVSPMKEDLCYCFHSILFYFCFVLLRD